MSNSWTSMGPWLDVRRPGLYVIAVEPKQTTFTVWPRATNVHRITAANKGTVLWMDRLALVLSCSFDICLSFSLRCCCIFVLGCWLSCCVSPLQSRAVMKWLKQSFNNLAHILYSAIAATFGPHRCDKTARYSPRGSFKQN